MDAGKITESEVVLDDVLERLQQDAKPVLRQTSNQSFSEFSPDKPLTTVGNLGLQLIFNSLDSPVARIESKMALIKKLAPGWIKKGGDVAKLQLLMMKVSQDGDRHNFVEAEKIVDQILSLLGATNVSTAKASEDAHREERDVLLADAKKFNLTGIEDYVGWSVVEPEQGKSKWDLYREDAAAIKGAGYRFVPYLWAQVLPKWVKSDSKYVLTSNVVTGLETEDLSIFAPETLEAYDHFYGEAQREMGDYVDMVRVGSPYDYGETSYPAAAANAQFPMKNLEPGFWVNEAPARAHFKETMKNKYGTVEQLNAAWGTRFDSFETIDYPNDNKNPRYWLDFMHWYQDGFTEMMGKIVTVAQKHFPQTPISFNLGWPYEKVNLGQDISGLVKMAAEKHVYLRTPTGPMVPFLYTKRVATAVRHYKPAGFSSEPVDGSAPLQADGSRLFQGFDDRSKLAF
ncbi:MAG: family 14 glycosylhydrolase [Verrucomicrobiota bacterium]